jgi:glyoxylase-like metal-dependent hydrolase (beta-lactamase superfamily II)
MCPRLLGEHTMVCHCLLIETERAGLVLVDTGLGTADIAGRLSPIFRALTRPRLDPAETAIARVRALGFDPRDVRHLVVTHLDLDHAGGIGDFPWATLHVHALERAAATARRTLFERHRYVPAQFAGHSHWSEVSEQGDDWYGLRAVRPLGELGDDVALVPLFGHTRGHSGVAVRTAGGWLLHAGDAYFHRSEVTRTPAAPAGLRAFQRLVEIDGRARRANRARVRELALGHPDTVQVFCAHDPIELQRLARASKPR